MTGIGEEASSPRNRLKFLCSFGGKILPRPSDGHLKYVGGETRVVAVPRTVTFSELRQKIENVFDAEVVIKYQLNLDDLDALVSVTCDEDLYHMLDEYDRHDLRSQPPPSSSTPRLRVFLFPSNPTVDHHQHQPHASLEQRYIDAINGVGVRSPASTPTAAINNRPSFRVSSASSSPKSATEMINHVDVIGLFSNGGERDACRHNSGVRLQRESIHRTHSSPNLQSVGQPHCHPPPPPQQQQQHGSRMYGFHHSGGPGATTGAVGYEIGVCQMGQAPPRHHPHHHQRSRYYSPVRVPRGSCVCCGQVDDDGSPRKRENFFCGAPARQQMWE